MGKKESKKELIEQGREAIQEEAEAGSASDPSKDKKDQDNPIQALKGREKQEKKQFLQELITHGGSVSAAADAAGVKLWKHYDKWKKDPAYLQAFDYAMDCSTTSLEAEAVRRAALGNDEPVFYQGQRVDKIRKYSDNLLMFLLKKRNPEYRDNNNTQIGIWGSDGGNVAIQFSIPRPERVQTGAKNDNTGNK